MKCPVPWSFARWPELGAGVRDSMSYTHSNHTCGTHIGTYIFGRYEGKGAGIRTQDCAALIPRESVCTEDCGTQRHSASVPPLRTASSFSLEELSSSLLYLQGPHYLWEPVVPGVSTFFFLMVQKDLVLGIEPNTGFLHHCIDSQCSHPANQNCVKEPLQGTSVFSNPSSPAQEPAATCRVVTVLTQVRN